MKATANYSHNRNGWNIEVFEGEKLIDWRCGLTKNGFNDYKKNFETLGYLSEGTKHNYSQFQNSQS